MYFKSLPNMVTPNIAYMVSLDNARCPGIVPWLCHVTAGM